MHLCSMPINLLQIFTLHKLWNASLVVSSYYTSKWLKKPNQKGMPISLSVEPTTACNLRCPECPSGLRSFSRPTGNLTTSLFKQIIDEQNRTLIYCNFYFQGEPFIHPQLLEMVAYAANNNIYTSTSTNAHFINSKNAEDIINSGISRIIISIDGTTQEVYEQYRKSGELAKVIEGTKALVAAKKKLKKNTQLVFQFLIVKPNEHQVEAVKTLGKELGVDKVVFKTAQLYDYKHGNELMPANEKFSRYKRLSNGTFSLKNKLLNQCWRLWSSAVITWDGKVVPCCFDKDAKHEMGNIKDQSFKEVWQNDAYQNFRASLLKARSKIDICTNCSEGTKVWTND
jgi:radical SAM protein with 4Fe4S-binding SPASM domain